MSTAYHSQRTTASSGERHGTVLGSARRQWDARGARVCDVVDLDPLVVLYDGRPRRRGQLVRDHRRGRGRAATRLGALLADDGEPARSPYSDGAYRYAIVGDGMPDGTHAPLRRGRPRRRRPRPGDDHRLSGSRSDAVRGRRLPNVLPSR